jgi:hypothetical protein
MSRQLARNWDLAVTSSALLLIVGGIALPHLRKLLAAGEGELEATA